MKSMEKKNLFTTKDTLKIKGIAIVMLIVHHMFLADNSYEINTIKYFIVNQYYIQKLAIAARICVWIFVFLSAYGCAYKYDEKREETKVYYIERWFSLMKGYWFIYILSFVLLIIFQKQPLMVYDKNMIYIFLDFFGLADFWGTPMLSGVWWYMCLAQFVLICVPVFYGMVKKYSGFCIVIFFVLLRYLNSGIRSNYGGTYTIYVYAILLGIVCYQQDILSKIKEKKKSVFELVCLPLVIVGGIYVKMKYASVDEYQTTLILFSLSACAFVILVFKYLDNAKLSEILIFLGKNSGNIFMTHMLLYNYFKKIVCFSHSVMGCIITLLTLCVLVSVCINYIKKVIKYDQIIDSLRQLIIRKAVQNG